MKGFYNLVEGISQKKHDEVFTGKIKTYQELNKDNILFHSENPQAKTYSYLLELVETDDAEVFEYTIVSIFI
ncbi:hypothetical protein [Flavobacterium reichenbachii]|uniref:Uncharacterized protein n=1 Tax=Flavobacterium reichenbachii TaxID=362418 RepID=A0A085ZGC4_9FLAO|nr:hypothetical protein [Flavobacterium reichenbachii]KFF03488.1 hypothetical protein IW19_21655 [Flavobacterium reichenbachii]OXB15689.1 hypothetical protein B0A68_09880 [Flavobacterium reichenbachii]